MQRRWVRTVGTRYKYSIPLVGLIYSVNDMGRIRPTYIKRVSIELINKYPQAFSKDFEANKEMVSTLTDVSSVKMRNRIAGYITRYLSHPEA